MKIYKFLRLFWVPKCRHNWEFKYTQTIEDEGMGTRKFSKVCRCYKCGEWKSFKV